MKKKIENDGGEKAYERKKVEEKWNWGKEELEGEADLHRPVGGPSKDINPRAESSFSGCASFSSADTESEWRFGWLGTAVVIQAVGRLTKKNNNRNGCIQELLPYLNVLCNDKKHHCSFTVLNPQGK